MNSKNIPLLRARTIDRCLRRPDHQWSMEKLKQACISEIVHHTGNLKTISTRTFREDIRAMRSGVYGYNAPIEYDHKEKSYYYSNPNFRIDNVTISKPQVNDIKNAILVLENLVGKHNITGIQSAISTLESAINLKRKVTDKYIEFEHSLNEAGQKWLSIIYEYISETKVMNALYTPFGKEQINIIVSPYLIKEYNSRWFVLCYSHKYKNLTILGLDRIDEIKESLQKFVPTEPSLIRNYFSEIVGVTRTDKKKIKIRFKAFENHRFYINTKPIHTSQKIVKKSDDFHVFELELIPNKELVSKFLALGQNVVVLSPLSFKKKIKSKLLETLNKYQ